MIDVSSNEHGKEYTYNQQKSREQNKFIPIADKLRFESAELIENFKFLNEDILLFSKNDKDYKIKEILFTNKLAV